MKSFAPAREPRGVAGNAEEAEPVGAARARAPRHHHDEVGRVAVRVATSGDVPHGSIVIRRQEGADGYAASFEHCELEKVARVTKDVPEEFMAGDNDVTPAFLDYVRPLVGELPVIGRLADHPVPRRL